MESSREPPGSVPVDEHEQGKLVEGVGPSWLLFAMLGEREPSHVGDRRALGEQSRMFDLVARSTSLASGLSRARRGMHLGVDRMDLVVSADDRAKGAAPQYVAGSAGSTSAMRMRVPPEPGTPTTPGPRLTLEP
jgi:hypothetical protein